MTFQRISVDEAKILIEKDNITLIDIRDFNSFSNGHIKNAIHIENLNIQHFINEKDKSDPVLIYCYHGNSSQPAANFFIQQGFKNVYSMDGGYNDWKQKL
ncbi:MAG: thiosulfate sulfurtransferase GlpE [Candidatus Puniceispirillales bacterium]|jgi:thiosulfate sulfurtransferase|nr:thiosulfate sulfurtransferase GlpE [Alphaproteobacteria bacterium]MDA0915887.1 thiosulfate sulfurtransferase GlpE [Pseudomonadota bacterium]